MEIKNSSLGIKKEIKEKFREFKRYIQQEHKLCDSKFLNFLIESNIKYQEMIYKKKLDRLKNKWLMENSEEIKETFNQFKDRMIREELKNG